MSEKILTVSPTDVVRVALDEPPGKSFSPEMARLGQQEHKRVYQKLSQMFGFALLGVETGGVIGGKNYYEVQPNVRGEKILKPGVLATAIADFILWGKDNSMIGETKPKLQGRYVLQMMLTALIFAKKYPNLEDSVMVTYGGFLGDKYWRFLGSGREYWQEGEKLLLLASRLMELDDVVRPKKKKVNKRIGVRQYEFKFEKRAAIQSSDDGQKYEAKSEMVEVRRAFDELLGAVNEGLQGKVVSMR